MINITMLNNSYSFLGINYNENAAKHTMVFQSLVGDVYIDIEREKFGDFMTAVVESYGEGVKHFAEEIKKEITQ